MSLTQQNYQKSKYLKDLFELINKYNNFAEFPRKTTISPIPIVFAKVKNPSE